MIKNILMFLCFIIAEEHSPLPSDLIMLKGYKLTLLAVFLMFPMVLSAADVQYNHPVYNFLERCELQGITANSLSQSKPYSRLTISKYLVQIYNNQDKLSHVEKGLLERYVFEFSDDIQRFSPGFSSDNPYSPEWRNIRNRGGLQKYGLLQNRRDIATYEGKDYKVFANVTGGFDYTSKPFNHNSTESGTQLVRSYGFSARAWYKRMDFAGWTTENQVSGNEAFIDGNRFPYRFGEGDSDQFDFYETETSVSYQDDYFVVYFGKGENFWGGSPESSLTLSDKGIPYTHFRIKGTLGPLEMTIIHGFIVAEPPIVEGVDSLLYATKKHYADKYFAAHRIQWNLRNNLQFGMYEEVFYGQRGMEWEYAPPILFFRGAEHYLRSQDNMLIGLDIRWLPVKNISFYGGFILDELVASNFGTSSYTNKQGAIASMACVNPLGYNDSRFFAEYVALRPYIYSHKFPISRADHYGITLANPGIPNSRKITLGLDNFILPSLMITMKLQQFKHGANLQDGTNVGGDHMISYNEQGLKHVKFLGGDVHTWNRAGLEVNWDIVYDLRFRFSGYMTEYSIDYESGDTGFDDIGFEWWMSLIWHPVH